ncbi:hypothetical protein HOD75_03645 [archaeon]|jgi:RNase P/RNase MRP subunit p30|nr:hypothetical protein [archaeon]MBT4241965.1 hypothetical protein [archaeon]MBT4418512.1 hypothetical protein [archaeon]
MITTSNLNQVRKEIQELKKNKKPIIVQAQSPEFNRKILENKDVDIFLNPELHDRKDFQKQRDSGLNEILCKLAKKNNIKIGIDLNKITKLNSKDKAIIISRIIQNIKLCKRTKTPIIIYPKNNLTKQEVQSFMQTLGASTQQGKEAFA